MSAYSHRIELPPRAVVGLNRAVVIGIRLSDAILDTIEEHPTRLYFHHYRAVNMLLDQLALRAALCLQEQGFRALPVPASQIIDWETQRSHLSHKELGRLAGLGWIGRNNLLVTRQFGSRFRLASLLTDAPLRPNTLSDESCGDCRACIAVCPAQAIKENPSDFDHRACFEKLREFQKKGYTGQYICGICVRACRGRI